MLASLGYLGAFLISLIGCSTFIVAIPWMAALFMLGSVLDPFLLAIVAGIGATIGEFTGYAIGYAVSYGGKKIKKKYDKKKYIKLIAGWNKFIKKFSPWFYKNGVLTIILFCLTPLPTDVIGFLCGTIKYSKKKFFFANFIGKSIMSFIIAIAGKYGIGWLVNLFGFG